MLTIPKIKKIKSQKVNNLFKEIKNKKLSENELNELIDNLNQLYIDKY